ncbi:MAG: hypothetical protein SOW25_07875 [Helicobacter sp.]|nr:hypothetical protein [Helicobacteraceae bacterium]MDY3114222.1 hypothetical protein [Helicobacter sp.]
MVKNWILFGYVREKTLFLALKHPAFKQEFYHKKKLIESCLKQFQEEKELLLEVEKIVHFVSYTKYQQHIDEVAKKEIPQTYGELSRGEFKNLATSKEVYRVFEEIREIILKNID